MKRARDREVSLCPNREEVIFSRQAVVSVVVLSSVNEGANISLNRLAAVDKRQPLHRYRRDKTTYPLH